MTKLSVLILSLGIILGWTLGPGQHSANAQTVVICAASSFGDAAAFQSSVGCPVPGILSDTSTLNKWDASWAMYLVAQSTFSSCGSCNLDTAFDANRSGSGTFYVLGQHNVSIAGYTPGYGVTYWYFNA